VSLRRLSFGLSRQLWIVEIGVFLNMLGYGAVFPFEVIYLHDERGFELGVAGLVAGLLTGAAVVTSPIAGAVIDRIGARATVIAAGLSLAAGYAGLAFAESLPAAVAAAALAGAGNGALGPSQAALMTALAPRELRHRASAVSRVAVNVGIGLGAAIGGLIAGIGLAGFVVLFLANAVTYIVYVAILAATVRGDAPSKRVPGGYRRLLRDRAFVHFALTNVALIVVGWGVLAWIVPTYAAGLGIASSLIGFLLLANAATVVFAQVPITRLAEGRSRVGALVLGAVLWVVACLLGVGAYDAPPTVAYLCLLVAAVGFAFGECLHATVFLPLVADLAPAELRGRYMAAIGLSWWLGLALAPTLGAQLLAVSPSLPLLAAGALSCAAIISLLALDARLPVSMRLVPRPQATLPR
jgi:MFS family permease